MEDPTYWRSVRDRMTGKEVILTQQQMSIIKRLQSSHFPQEQYDQYEVRLHPLLQTTPTILSFYSHMLISSVVKL